MSIAKVESHDYSKYFRKLSEKPFRYNGKEHPGFNAEEALEEVVWAFKDYAHRRITRNEVMNTLRDYYYILETGMKYREWVNSKRS